MTRMLHLTMAVMLMPLTLAVAHDGAADHGAKGVSAVDAAVAKTIQSFEPFWKPPVGVLSGVTVVIDPVGGGATTAPQRTCEDNSVLTASYLWHFIQKAGGRAIVTRLGDGPSAIDQSGSVSPLEFARDAPRTAFISIRFDRESKQTIFRFHAGKSPPDSGNLLTQSLHSGVDQERVKVELVEDLRSQLVKDAAGASDLAAVTPSLCQVVFPCLEKGNRREQRDRAVCRKIARVLCEGLIRSFQKTILPQEASSKNESLPAGFDRAGASRARGVARRIWPDGKLPSDKVNWFVGMYKRLALPNQSLCYFNVSIKNTGGGLVIVGSTNVPNVVMGLIFALNEVGIERVRSDVRTLPDVERLEGKIHGLCTVSLVRTYDRPGSADGLTQRALQTQLLYGEPLYLLDREGEFYLAHAGDGYWGWVPRAAVRPMDVASFREYRSHPRGVVVADIESGALRIPRGASLPLAGKVDGRMQVKLPTGELFPVATSVVRSDRSAVERAQERVRAALDLLQTPYLFGGKSPLGIDCSGLVANVSKRVNLPSARDAWQQAMAGYLVATSWDREGIVPGDQVFFINSSGKIYHTGIAISDHHVLHAASPGVQIGSLRKGDRLFNARLHRDFFVAKRP